MSALNPVEIPLGAVYTEDPPREDGYTTYVDGTVDTSVAGVYTITYTLIRLQPTFDSKTYTREVTVTAIPPSTGTITLNGDPVISILLADTDTYSDEGASSSSGTVFVTNLDGTSSESFTGLPNVAGSYTLIYYTSGATSNFVTRTIHVIDPNSGGGGGGGGVSAPSSGPTNLNTTYTHVGKPATGFPITTIDTENSVVKPATGFPIVTIDTDDTGNKPATGFPITTIDTDDTGNKPATGFPIESISSN